MTGQFGALRHGRIAADNTRLRAENARLREDLALLLLSLHLAGWVVQVDPTPPGSRRRPRASRYAAIPSPRPPSAGS